MGGKHTPTRAELYKWCDEENIESITIYVDQESTKKRKKAFGWKTTDGRKAIRINRMPQGKGKDHGENSTTTKEQGDKKSVTAGKKVPVKENKVKSTHGSEKR